MITTRRSFLTLLAAPAIVRAASLMPISAKLLRPPTIADFVELQSVMWQNYAGGFTVHYLTKEAPVKFVAHRLVSFK